MLGERLEELMGRYEEALEEKQEELGSLKTRRTQNLLLLKELAQKVSLPPTRTPCVCV